MKHILRSLCALLAVAALVPSTGLAQETGTVSGRVTSSDGQALVGTAVTIGGTRLGTLAGDGGAYVLTNVPAGDVTVRASMIGYAPASVTVSVPAGGTATADFVLMVDALNLETLVVTGTGTETRKVEATYSITNLTADEIEAKAPQNTAELLEVVPGFYVESSGGEGGNNVWARGIPQDGGFRYVAFYEDGLPVFESPELAFTNIDLLFRTDLTTRTMEAVRGGSASIFASNAPGGLINFMSQTGGDELVGKFRLTGGDYNLFRADVNYGGPLGEDWRFNVGGFYRFDRGVRSPGFPANRGGQIKANLTRLLDNGYLRFSVKHMNEKNIFYLPVPLQNPEDPTDIPGFDANFGTMTSNDAARIKIPTPKPQPGGGATGVGDVLDLNLKDGMHPVYTAVGAEGFFDLGDGWTLKDAFRYTDVDVQFNAIFSVNSPVDAATFGQQKADELGGDSFRYSFTNSGATFNPANANGNGLVVNSGWWAVTKPMSNFVNNFQISKNWAGEIDNSVTFGFYFSEYQADEFWLFNNILQEVRDAPRLLELDILDDGGNTVTSVTQNGFTRYGDLYVNHSGNANVYALYAQDTWKPIEKLTIDAGGRWEYMEVNGSVENSATFDLGDPNTVADDDMGFGTGTFRPYDFDFDDFAWSVGIGYMFSDQFGLFGRYTDGFRMPDFEQWIFSRDAAGNISEGDVEDVKQAEIGVKYGSPMLGIFATGFYSELSDVFFSDEVVVDGDLVTAARFADTETIGLETEIVFVPIPGFEASWRGTIQQPEYTGLRLDESFPFELPPDLNFDGNQIRRIPEIISQVRLSYQLPEEYWNFRLWGTWNYIDERFVDDANNVVLPDYNVIGGGLAFDVTPQVGVQLVAHNIFNAIGLTEGNPREGQVVGSQQDIFMARPILGRNAQLAVTYNF
ncbi:MAG: TonB-dependent receptor [Gemmatimonadota bacterium]|nr:TonB-dependent receptor [Gemmatimonadota bacterium]